MSEMNPTQALQLIDRVLADVAGSRFDHQRLQQAVQVLAEAIQPVEEPEPKDDAH